MRPRTLRNGLVLIVVAAVLPVGVLSVAQALSALSYSRTLIVSRLVTNALLTVERGHDPIVVSKQVLLALSENDAVRNGGQDCHDVLKLALANTPGALNLARADQSGRVQCSALAFERSTSFADTSWWQRGNLAGKYSLSAVVDGPITKKRILVGLQPILNKAGGNDGAIMVAIDASWLERSLAQSQMSKDAAVAIIDSQGHVVLTSDSRPLPQFDVVAANAHVVDAVAKNGIAWMYAVAPLYNRELFVVYAEPTEQLMATALKQEQIGLILPIAALLLAMLSIWIGTTRLVLRWLESVRALAAQFANGNFSDERNRFVKAPREINLLVNDLHNMADAVEARDSALKVLLDAKTAMTHEIHHRVKNNLQIVSSLLNLQTEKLSDPAAREALKQTRARIGALAQIHRLLYEDGHDSDQENVDIAKLLHALSVQLRALNGREKGVTLACEAEPQMVPINHAVPLTLLAVEAVTNAFRHGFPMGRSGRVVVHFHARGGEATLWIKDDGIGYALSDASTSMGQQLMEAFAQQLGGSLNIVSALGVGTTVTLVYPLH